MKDTVAQRQTRQFWKRFRTAAREYDVKMWQQIIDDANKLPKEEYEALWLRRVAMQVLLFLPPTDSVQRKAQLDMLALALSGLTEWQGGIDQDHVIRILPSNIPSSFTPLGLVI